MATKLTENTLSGVYRDDFDPEKGYHRILFNSGRHLQARELTQLQTIIQNEIETFGKNIFKEGASVNPGGCVIDNKYPFIKLDTSIPLPSDPQSIVGRLFEGATSGVTVKVLEVVPSINSDPPTIYVQYVNTVSGTSGTTPVRVNAGEELTEREGSVLLKVQTTNTQANPAVGFGTKITIGGADFFTLGFFVRAAKQGLILSKYSSSVTTTVGFRATQEIVTVDDDVTLYDNQGALPNTTAPGADRLKINLTLIEQSDLAADESFVYYARIVDSAIVDRVSGFDQYNTINDFLAIRTNEESGDYTVNPFYIRYQESTVDPVNNLTLRVSPGVAYVNGYRINKTTPTFIEVEKSTGFEEVTGESIGADYGYYVVLEDLHGVPDIENFERLTISSQKNAFTDVTGVALDTTTDKVVFPVSGNTSSDATSTFYHIGSCRVRSIERTTSGLYRMYLFDIQMDTDTLNRIGNGQKFNFKTHARSVGLQVTSEGERVCYGIIKTDNARAEIKETQNENLLFPLPQKKPRSISNARANRLQARFTATVAANGSAVVSTASGATFADTDSWIVTKTDDPDGNGTTTLSKEVVSNDNLAFSGVGTSSVTIAPTGGVSLGSTGDNIEVLAYVTRTITPATKTKTAVSLLLSFDNSLGYLDLTRPDIISVEAIKYGSAAGEDASANFILDNGQRDTHYQNGRLILKEGKSLASTAIYVEFTHYIHSKSGNFFCANSYGNDLYLDNPTHTLKDGTVVNLSDVLDFRPTMDDDYEFDGADAVRRILPQDADVLIADVTYYLPRLDKVILDENGNLTLLKGNASRAPAFAETPENAMELYRVRMNPFSIDENDLTYRMIENKRYTMRDIGKIEKRIDELEKVTSLSLLELDTKNVDVLDAEGRNRTKSGFFVDNFEDQYYTDTRSEEYKGSVDPKARLARPGYLSRNIGLVYDSDLSTNTVLKGDTVYLKYDETLAISQTQVSRTENVNPLLVISYPGHITLSPASDEWKETRYEAQNVISGGTVLNRDAAILWDEWQWNWHGVNLNGLDVGDTTTMTEQVGSRNFREQNARTITTGIEVTTQTVTNRVVSSQTIREVIGDRVIDVALIPFMRSRLVYFKVEGMQPNTQIFPFFDGVRVDSWCRREDFKRVNDNREEIGNRFDNVTEHPFGGSTTLFTDGRGSCEGSFFIPNTDNVRFRSGSLEFKFLDITVDEPQNATSVARAVFSSAGLLHTRQEDVLSTRVLEIVGNSTVTTNRQNVFVRRPADPIAQSFFVTEPDGMYLTKASVYFQSKDATAPVWVQIRPMVNGYPSSYAVVPGSYKLLSASQVAVSEDATVATDFVFDEPVFLNSFTEYCIMIQTVSEDYNVWISRMGDFELGTTEKRISRQPFLGSFFKSQNSFTWEASSFDDLKFDLYKANFENSQAGKAVFTNATPSLRKLGRDPIELWYDSSNDNVIRIYHEGHGHTAGDTVLISGVDSTNDFGEFLNGSHAITAVDPTGYSISRPSGINISNKPTNGAAVRVGGDTTLSTENYQFNLTFPSLETLIPNNTSVSMKGQFHTGKSFAGNETPYVQDGPEAFDLKIKENNYFEHPRVIRNQQIEGTGLSSSAVITLNMNTASNDVCPSVDLHRASLVLVENVIDNPVSGTPSGGQNAPLQFAAETGLNSGSASAKHITRPVSLINTAVGLRVILGANRPSVCDIKLYYKTSSGGDALSGQPWVYVEPDAPVPSDENSNVFREYTYTIGGEDGTLEEFDNFQLKIVYTSSNSSRVPTLRDLRVIALGD